MTQEEREEGELDDWFAEHEKSPREQRHEAGPTTEWEHEQWLSEPPQPADRSPRTLADAVRKRRLLAGAVLFSLSLLIGLAAGGVFSGGGKRASEPTGISASIGVLAPSSTSAPFTPPRPPHLTTTLKRGARGPSVVALQRALARLGYYSGRIDGDYGPGTESAVSRFQTDSGLTPDGIAGPLTRRALEKALGQDELAGAKASPPAPARRATAASSGSCGFHLCR